LDFDNAKIRFLDSNFFDKFNKLFIKFLKLIAGGCIAYIRRERKNKKNKKIIKLRQMKLRHVLELLASI